MDIEYSLLPSQKLAFEPIQYVSHRLKFESSSLIIRCCQIKIYRLLFKFPRHHML